MIFGNRISAQRFPLAEPLDGWTYFERQLMRDLLVAVYRSIPLPTDRFILISIYEVGYTQEEVSQMLGLTQEAVQKRLAKTLTTLRANRVL